MLQSFNLKFLYACIQTKYQSGVILNTAFCIFLVLVFQILDSLNIFLLFVDVTCNLSLQCFKLLWRSSPVKW